MHGVLPSGDLYGEGWVRHGEPPSAAIARVTAGAVAGRVATQVNSSVVDLPQDGGRVHVIALGYPVPGGVPSAGDGPMATPPALFDEPPPTDHIDHLIRDAGREARQDAGGDARGAAGPGPERRVETPVKVQRAGAYAVVTDGGGRVLLAHLARTNLWTLPGGGVDFGEHPEEALRREFHEETGLTVTIEGLLDVGSAHWTGRAPDGRLEDFHAVQVIYRGTVPAGSEPAVLEVNGSTDLAEWVAVDDLAGLEFTHVGRFGLSHLPDLR